MHLACFNVRKSLLFNGSLCVVIGLWFVAWTVVCYWYDSRWLAWQLDTGTIVGERRDETFFAQINAFIKNGSRLEGLAEYAKAKRPPAFAFRPAAPWRGGLVERWPNQFELAGRVVLIDGESLETVESGDSRSEDDVSIAELRKNYKKNLKSWRDDVQSDMYGVTAMRGVVAVTMIGGGVVAVLVAMKVTIGIIHVCPISPSPEGR